MKNVILFGGAFDPIHNGHLNMAFFASKELDADVFFIPAKKSVWKDESAPVSDKIEMIKLAIKDYPRFFVNTYEADRKEDVTYSIETVRYFVNEYKDAKFFFLIGVDQVNEFHRWKECDEISRLVQLVYFPRPGYEPKKENIERFQIRALDSKIECDAASNQIREFRSFETPLEVINYILEHSLYDTKRFRSYFSEHRYNHVVSVANLAFKVAEANNYKTPGRAFLAGLMHDCAKGYDGEKANKIMVESFSEYKDMEGWSYHQFVGAYVAEKEFGITDKEILEAIKFHASGCANMTELQKIIYACDKIDPLREYDSSEYIKAMMEGIDSGFLVVLKANIEYLHAKSKSFMNPLTKSCIDFYLK